MNWKKISIAGALVGTGTLLYGCFIESKCISVEHKILRLKNWTTKLSGFKIALIADLHIKDQYSLDIAYEAVIRCVESKPDIVIIAGDFVGYWKENSYHMCSKVLEPLKQLQGQVIAVPGNHDYFIEKLSCLDRICIDSGIKLLKNEAFYTQGIHWVGIDSENKKKALPHLAFERLKSQKNEIDKEAPTIALWHEPDMVLKLPEPVNLMLSGHSHGGQYLFPFGITPVTPRNAKIYYKGFYPNAPTPLYVTRGVGTTGPPTRFLCPPEVAILTLIST